ncbi:MAG: 50S ribosomal protein L29 [bacterium]
MKAKEINKKNEKELQTVLKEKRLQLGEMRFTLSSKKIKNVKEVSVLRRDIARILTILNSRKQNG